jgi:hypothetical protein
MMEERNRHLPVDIGPLQVLRTIIYQMFYLEDLDGFVGVDDRAILRLAGLYPMERIQRFRMALDWAMVCTDFDFASLLPNLPYKNEQIVSYLRVVHETLEEHARQQGWPDTFWAPTRTAPTGRPDSRRVRCSGCVELSASRLGWN